MPRFEKRYSDLAERGPDVYLTLARPSAVQVPSGVFRNTADDVRALIDTGATLCAIRQTLAQELGLQQFDERPFGNSTGTTPSPIYLVDLIFEGHPNPIQMEVAGCSFEGQRIEFVLGRNFLALATLSYNGSLGSYCLEF